LAKNTQTIEIIVIADKPIIYRYRDNFELARYRHHDNDNSHPVIVIAIAIVKKIIVNNPARIILTRWYFHIRKNCFVCQDDLRSTKTVP